MYPVKPDRSEVYFVTSQPEPGFGLESWSAEGDVKVLRAAFEGFHPDGAARARRLPDGPQAAAGRSRAARALGRGQRGAAGRRLPSHDALHGAGRGDGDRGCGDPVALPRPARTATALPARCGRYEATRKERTARVQLTSRQNSLGQGRDGHRLGLRLQRPDRAAGALTSRKPRQYSRRSVDDFLEGRRRGSGRGCRRTGGRRTCRAADAGRRYGAARRCPRWSRTDARPAAAPGGRRRARRRRSSCLDGGDQVVVLDQRGRGRNSAARRVGFIFARRSALMKLSVSGVAGSNSSTIVGLRQHLVGALGRQDLGDVGHRLRPALVPITRMPKAAGDAGDLLADGAQARGCPASCRSAAAATVWTHLLLLLVLDRRCVRAWRRRTARR